MDKQTRAHVEGFIDGVLCPFKFVASVFRRKPEPEPLPWTADEWKQRR